MTVFTLIYRPTHIVDVQRLHSDKGPTWWPYCSCGWNHDDHPIGTYHTPERANERAERHLTLYRDLGVLLLRREYG